MLDFIPDILHLHDYHFALAALLLKDIKDTGKNPVFDKTKSVFTIHNIAYQGSYDRDILDICGIDGRYYSVDGLEFYGKVNFMKAGIVYSDRITTVSPTYAEEILTPEYGYGLDGILSSRMKDLSGIINGIDYALWNPETDSSIFQAYSSEDLSGKNACKRELLNTLFGKKISLKKPLLGMVSRLSEQKGLDLVADAMGPLMEEDVYLVILGTGDEQYHKILKDLQKKYSKKFSLTLAYSDKISREIYSGSDIFLMPSKYEPCGLGQLISLKYGTIPLVRNTGGLSDTIMDIRSDSDVTNGGTGFKFDLYDSGEFHGALKRALDFYGDSTLWKKIVINGMKCDFSWDYSAREYKKLYKSTGL
jgi:starch synthase